LITNEDAFDIAAFDFGAFDFAAFDFAAFDSAQAQFSEMDLKLD
jgi:hypothetical protein